MLSDNVIELRPGAPTHFGCGSIEKLPQALRTLERERALVVTDPGVERAGIVARVKSVLEAQGLLVEVSCEERRPPSGDRIGPLLARAKAEPRSVLFAVGGGSVIDTAKAVALLATNGGSVNDYPPGCRPARPALPLIAVPTTAGAGAEANMFAHLLDPKTGRTVVLAHPSVLPAAVVLDPELSLSLPADVTGASGMVALAHAVEAFTSSRHNPYSDALALRALAAIATYLPRAHRSGSDIEARAQMAFAAHLAGLAHASAGLGLCQAMAHALVARRGLPHGQALATCLPHVMRFNFAVCEGRYAQLAIALGAASPGESDAKNAERAIVAVERLAAAAGTPLGLGARGVEGSSIATLVEDAMADWALAGTPRFPEPGDVLALYEAAR